MTFLFMKIKMKQQNTFFPSRILSSTLFVFKVSCYVIFFSVLFLFSEKAPNFK